MHSLWHRRSHTTLGMIQKLLMAKWMALTHSQCETQLNGKWRGDIQANVNEDSGFQAKGNNSHCVQ